MKSSVFIILFAVLLNSGAFAIVHNTPNEENHKNNNLNPKVSNNGRALSNVYFPRLRFGIHGGYSYMNGKVNPNIPDELNGYIKDAKSGLNLGADAAFFIKKGFGIGLKYHLFRTSAEKKNVPLVDENENSVTGNISDKISVNYITPTIYLRVMAQKKHVLYLNLSIGYMYYKNKFQVIDKYTMTGKDVAFMEEIGYDYRINRNLAIGIQVSHFSGNLIEYKINDGNSTQTFNTADNNISGVDAGHFSLSVGMRYYL